MSELQQVSANIDLTNFDIETHRGECESCDRSAALFITAKQFYAVRPVSTVTAPGERPCCRRGWQYRGGSGAPLRRCGHRYTANSSFRSFPSKCRDEQRQHESAFRPATCGRSNCGAEHRL